jgi:hypothetical protein
MYYNKKLLKTTTNNKEYKAAQGKYTWVWTVWIDRKAFRNWKLYRKTQYKPVNKNLYKRDLLTRKSRAT